MLQRLRRWLRRDARRNRENCRHASEEAGVFHSNYAVRLADNEKSDAATQQDSPNQHETSIEERSSRVLPPDTSKGEGVTVARHPLYDLTEPSNTSSVVATSGISSSTASVKSSSSDDLQPKRIGSSRQNILILLDKEIARAQDEDEVIEMQQVLNPTNNVQDKQARLHKTINELYSIKGKVTVREITPDEAFKRTKRVTSSMSF